MSIMSMKLHGIRYYDDMIQDNMDFLDMEAYGSDYDIDAVHTEGIGSQEGVEFIAIPAWRMADGNLIALQDMDTSHIWNCIKMIHRSDNTWRKGYLKYFEEELRRRKFLNNPPAVIFIDL